MTDTATPELSLCQRQIELEQGCITLGVARYEAALEKATAREEVGDTRPAIALIRRMIDPTALLIEEFVAAALTACTARCTPRNTAGRTKVASWWLTRRAEAETRLHGWSSTCSKGRCS